MPFHSEDVWEDFDALWRRVQALGRQVKELEARLAMLESPGAESSRSELNAIGARQETKATSAAQRRE